jgi:hypothetical protein
MNANATLTKPSHDELAMAARFKGASTPEYTGAEGLQRIFETVMESFNLSGNYSQRLRSVVHKRDEELIHAQNLIAEWAAERRASEGDVGIAIEAMHDVGIARHFMLVALDRLPSQAFHELYKLAVDHQEIYGPSVAGMVNDAAERLETEAV